ncbi:hypothetical protein BLAT2472_40595 [Burkholderia latens]
MLDQTEQSIILMLADTDCLPLPDVIAAAMHAKDSAHRMQAELAEMGSHERVPCRYPCAKYAAAFFRMSRSSVMRLSSAFSRRTSAL